MISHAPKISIPPQPDQPLTEIVEGLNYMLWFKIAGETLTPENAQNAFLASLTFMSAIKLCALNTLWIKTPFITDGSNTYLIIINTDI